MLGDDLIPKSSHEIVKCGSNRNQFQYAQKRHDFTEAIPPPMQVRLHSIMVYYRRL